MFFILPEKPLINKILMLKAIVKSLFLKVFIMLDSEMPRAIEDKKNGIPYSPASRSVYISNHWKLLQLPNARRCIFHYWFLMNQSAEQKMKSHSTAIRTFHNSWCNFVCVSSADRFYSHAVSAVFKFLHLAKSPEQKGIATFLSMHLILIL